MGRVGLDDGVAKVAAVVLNRPVADLTAADLKELMIGFAFHAKDVSAIDAARFCFVALRREVEDAIAMEELHDLVEHSLLGRTCEMSRGERRRWMIDLFGDLPRVSFADFTRYFLHNYAMWAAFGVPLAVDMATSPAQCHHHLVGPLSEALEAAGEGGAFLLDHPEFQTPLQIEEERERGGGRREEGGVMISGSPSAPSHQPPANEWRTFVVLVKSTKKSFSVTAHVEDRVGDVMQMVEASCGIKAARQEWWIGGETRIEAKTRIGSTTLGVPPALKSSRGSSPRNGPPSVDVVIKEQEETIVLNFSYKAKNMRWQERVPAEEKVLKLRAAVQRRTLIPLSRCTLRVVSAEGEGGKESKTSSTPAVILQDRHPISHYHLESGVMIEVLQQ
ncbi:unnamed protein product [Phytomonas sp. EM1]|nr:unnamed protein product [Phytomonas sp. EM1]|eukprot:CCW63150.1 unnamed protein product [Phytomonas sp. isolate EM1]